MSKFFIIGTGSCGTTYLSNILTQIGIPCTHETLHNTWDENYHIEPQDLPGNIQCDSNSLGAIVAKDLKRKGYKILHVYRDHTKTVDTIYKKDIFKDWNTPICKFIEKHVPAVKSTDDVLRKISLFLWYWNGICAEHADYSIDIEKTYPEQFNHVLTKFGYNIPIEKIKKVWWTTSHNSTR